MAGDQETFEAVYSRLEEAVEQLEAGGMPLDDSIALFEQGMALARRCKALLEGAELRVTTLVTEYEATGSVVDGSRR